MVFYYHQFWGWKIPLKEGHLKALLKLTIYKLANGSTSLIWKEKVSTTTKDLNNNNFMAVPSYVSVP
ncbi:hypothetical protein S83_000921 [Arachis hypogaea]